MTSLLDSSAHFEERCAKLGLTPAFVTALAGSHVDNLSKLAFVIGQPGQPIQNQDVTDFLQNALGRAPTLAETTALKRLGFEAHTYLVATLRQQVDQSDETQPRKVAYAERTQRMDRLRQDLRGLDITGELEPSHGLLDKCCAIFDSNNVKWLEPSICISRSMEVQGTPKSRELTLEKGSLILKHDDKQTCSTDSEIKLHYAMTRRAIALAFATVLTYQQHNAWMCFLFESLHREVPPGYSKANLSQVVSCDKAAWSRLATIGVSTREAADGSFPLGEALLALKSDPAIMLYLAPLAKPVQSAAPGPSRPAPYQTSGGKAHAGKGKGKSSAKGKTPPMPQELRGKYHKTASNEPICFAFNTSTGCSHSNTVKAGDRCPKGLHVCAEPRCQQRHSLQQHGKWLGPEAARDWSGLHIEQLFMVEVFAGGAVLTSVAKQYGLGGIAVDKVRKQNARSTIYQLDLMQQADRQLLEQWLASPLLLWAHFAPVCGTASRAREIPRPELASAPQPLRSLEFQLGLPDLSPGDRKRVEIANELFRYTCHLFAMCLNRGVLATMENPRGSYLWVIPFVLELMRAYSLFATDFQACMYGSMRDKWTRVIASFPEISQMDATCDRRHKHAGWGFTTNSQGQKVWATAEESQYPRKLCIALTQIVLRVAESHGVQLRPNCIHDIMGHPLLSAKHSQMAAGRQPRGNKIPPLVPDFQQTAVFYAKQPSDIPCGLMGKLPSTLTLMTEAKQLVEVPKYARFLRGSFISDSKMGVVGESEKVLVAEGWPYKVVFGLPWDCEQFVHRAVDAGHPSKIGLAVPKDLQLALEKHMSWSEQTLVQYRMDWCRKWLKRARHLDRSERWMQNWDLNMWGMQLLTRNFFWQKKFWRTCSTKTWVCWTCLGMVRRWQVTFQSVTPLKSSTSLACWLCPNFWRKHRNEIKLCLRHAKLRVIIRLTSRSCKKPERRLNVVGQLARSLKSLLEEWCHAVFL